MPEVSIQAKYSIIELFNYIIIPPLKYLSSFTELVLRCFMELPAVPYAFLKLCAFEQASLTMYPVSMG